MVGAILGDIIGSRFESRNTLVSTSFKSKEFELFAKGCKATDDSIMTMAIAKAVFMSQKDSLTLAENAVRCMQEFGRKVKYAGYGGTFRNWLWMEEPKPYNSFGNGASMRVSPVALVAKSLEECKQLSKTVTEVTHNHPEGIKGAECESACIFLAKSGASKKEIQDFVQQNYYDMDFKIDDIRKTYAWSVTCQGSLPQAIKCFLESSDYEDCIRNCISLGGDSDTMAAMAGAIAQAFYTLPDDTHKIAQHFCLPEMFCYVQALEYLYNGYKGELSKETKEILN